MTVIGLPAETKVGERRVVLAPTPASSVVAAGHTVIVRIVRVMCRDAG